MWLAAPGHPDAILQPANYSVIIFARPGLDFQDRNKDCRGCRALRLFATTFRVYEGSPSFNLLPLFTVWPWQLLDWNDMGAEWSGCPERLSSPAQDRWADMEEFLEQHELQCLIIHSGAISRVSHHPLMWNSKVTFELPQWHQVM